MAVTAGGHSLQNGATLRAMDVADLPFDKMSHGRGQRLDGAAHISGGHQRNIAIKNHSVYRICGSAQPHLRLGIRNPTLAITSDRQGSWRPCAVGLDRGPHGGIGCPRPSGRLSWGQLRQILGIGDTVWIDRSQLQRVPGAFNVNRRRVVSERYVDAPRGRRGIAPQKCRRSDARRKNRAILRVIKRYWP